MLFISLLPEILFDYYSIEFKSFGNFNASMDNVRAKIPSIINYQSYKVQLVNHIFKMQLTSLYY